MKKFGILIIVAMVLSGCTSTGWKQKMSTQLPQMGHRNWIIIADSAYPKQNAPGIETIYTGTGQLEVLDAALKELGSSRHVRPLVLVDAELGKINEADAPGINDYRQKLHKMLEGKQFQELEHMKIIGKLNEASKLFDVLILKTDLTLPYSSVFLELDCAYWNAEKENRLREALK